MELTDSAIRISGENFGGISTTQEFADYHLQLKFKWGEVTWVPKKGKKRDSGVLYHCVGPHGADYGFWMRSQEFPGTGRRLRMTTGRGRLAWRTCPQLRNPTVNTYTRSRRKISLCSELKNRQALYKIGECRKPNGEWNIIDIYCHGDTSVHMVNGKTVMVLYKNAQFDSTGERPLTRGKIQIQSEGAEVFYKDIRIQQISKIPGEAMKAE
jgi:hypothetical protein